jgi:hypothetical protein
VQIRRENKACNPVSYITEGPSKTPFGFKFAYFLLDSFLRKLPLDPKGGCQFAEN